MEWAILALVVLPMLAAYVVAQGWNMTPYHAHDTRKSEAEGQMGSMKGQARVAYAKTGKAPVTLTGDMEAGGAGVQDGELNGKHYDIVNDIYCSELGYAVLIAKPNDEDDDWGVHMFSWQGGSGTFSWEEADSLEDLLAKIGVTP